MDEHKLKQLFDTLRDEPALDPPADFDQDVMRQLPAQRQTDDISLWVTLENLFPRLIWSPLALILVCAIVELRDRADGVDSLTAASAALAEHLLHHGI